MIKYYKQCKEIERLNNIINELECWLRKNLPIEEKNDLQICLNKLEQLKNKKIYGSSKYEVVYFGEALGSDKEWVKIIISIMNMIIYVADMK